MKRNLKIISFVFYVLLLCINHSFSQHTFSIVAIDSTTQEVGSACASFVGGAPRSLINKATNVHPAAGAINTQASYNEQNQILANQLMDSGLSPQEIIDSVIVADSEGDPSLRQYIIVDIVNGGRTAAYTGVSCPDYANHILGKNYAIAGNILYGQDVLDKMQAGFLNTSGRLADKLLAALQGGKEAGGDKRGESYGLSSLMATMRIAKPVNSKDSLYLDLFVAYGTSGWELLQDPVDSLQILYNKWKEETNVIAKVHEIPDYYCLFQNYPNPFNPSTTIEFSLYRFENVVLKIYNLTGQEIATLVSEMLPPGKHKYSWNASGFSSGIYLYRLQTDSFVQTKKLAFMQ